MIQYTVMGHEVLSEMEGELMSERNGEEIIYQGVAIGMTRTMDVSRG